MCRPWSERDQLQIPSKRLPTTRVRKRRSSPLACERAGIRQPLRSDPAQRHPAFFAAFLALGAGLGSRFFFSSVSETVLGTPPEGTSSLAVQRIAFRTRVRKSGLAQFAWKWAPGEAEAAPAVGPLDRPGEDLVASLGGGDVGIAPRAGPRTFPSRASSSGLATMIGVTPFISGRNRML